MGMIADVWVQKHQRKQARRDVAGEFGRLRRQEFDQMSDPDFGFVPAELRQDLQTGETRQIVTWGNYLEFRLRQLRLVDRKLLDMMAMSFSRMDTQSRGYINLDDLERGILMESETFEELTPKRGDQTPRIFTRAPVEFDIETPRNRDAVGAMGHSGARSIGSSRRGSDQATGTWATPRHGDFAAKREPVETGAGPNARATRGETNREPSDTKAAV